MVRKIITTALQITVDENLPQTQTSAALQVSVDERDRADESCTPRL